MTAGQTVIEQENGSIIGSGGFQPTDAFFVSDAAAARIAYLLHDEPAGSRLRVSVEGGGCSGFQYHFTFDAAPLTTEDQLFGHPGAEVVIDDVSLGFLNGAMIDYVENLGASYFEIKNPNSASSCGCGNSFAV
jgi:iron-sulfur cluster insertion protein